VKPLVRVTVFVPSVNIIPLSFSFSSVKFISSSSPNIGILGTYYGTVPPEFGLL